MVTAAVATANHRCRFRRRMAFEKWLAKKRWIPLLSVYRRLHVASVSIILAIVDTTTTDMIAIAQIVQAHASVLQLVG